MQKAKHWFNLFFGPLLFCFVIYGIYKQIAKQPNLHVSWKNIKEAFSNFWLWFAFLLMILNYFIEAIKWKFIIKKINDISIKTSLKSVFAGSSITMFTPNRTGEYGGRILFLPEGKRLQAIALNIVGSISQMLVTIIMGSIGLFVLYNNPLFTKAKENYFGGALLYTSISICIFGLLFYFKLPILTRLIEKRIKFKAVKYFINILNQFTIKQLVYVICLSLLRYLTFVAQFVIVMQVMDTQINWVLNIWLITIFYLVITLLPTFGLLELPVRLETAAIIFSLFCNNALGIQAAQFTILIINLIIPAIIGGILILTIKKIFKE